MTTFEFDLSKSDSFIDGIQEIFKPPSVESSTNVRTSKSYLKTPQHSFSTEIKEGNIDFEKIGCKKPKWTAHDYCDSCGTFEGERLVCDRCPSTFHLECLDPPMEVDAAPLGVWFCTRCSAVMKHDQGRATSSSSSGCSEITTEMLSEDAPVKRKKSSEDFKFKRLKALRNLHEVIQCINPREFELPRLLIPGIKLPSTYKTNEELKSKSVVSLENGVIPRPRVTCSECNRTCLYGSLLQCDYCPLYFHLDCLDPPLVQLPSRVERWMCPNHIEQVIDNSGMIKTIRLSERLNVYEEMNKRISDIDEVDLLINFGLGRGFRFGSDMEDIVKRKPKIKVPDAVKKMYKLSLMVKTDNAHEPNIFNDQQKLVLKKILQVSNKDLDIHETDILTLFHETLDSLERLIECKSLNLSPNVLYKSSVISKQGADQVKCRALIIPISNDTDQRVLSSPIRMIYRNFDIGSSSDNDCVISGCKYVSAVHASISYIDNHFCFELVNYSRYGSIVDDILYYNDVSDKHCRHNSLASQNVKDIKSFIDNTVAGSNNRAMRSQRDVDKEIESCACTEFGYNNHALNDCTEHGWEGAAPLRFGSVIRIGCQKFLFTEINENFESSILDSSHSSISSINNISPKSEKEDVSSPTEDDVQVSPQTKVTNTE